MKQIQIILVHLLVLNINAFCQNSQAIQMPRPKRFIEKVEFVIGGGLCFNYGNMFIENYRSEFANGNFVTNTRLMKPGFSVGLGVYHPINDKIDINVRLLWEQKGYRSELNTTLSTGREFRESDYSYHYFTVPVAAKLFIDKKKRFAISLGGYLSQISSVWTTEKFYNTLDNTRTSSSFTGRTLVAFDVNGGINTASFIPGLQGFAEYDYGATLGFSYNLRLAEKHLLAIQVIDNFGLTNVNKMNFTAIPSPDERNHTVSLMVAYVYQRTAKN